MDLSFAGQALATEWLVKHRDTLEPRVYNIPADIDESIARLKLEALGVRIDALSPSQVQYSRAWREGT